MHKLLVLRLFFQLQIEVQTPQSLPLLFRDKEMISVIKKAQNGKPEKLEELLDNLK